MSKISGWMPSGYIEESVDVEEFDINEEQLSKMVFDIIEEGARWDKLKKNRGRIAAGVIGAGIGGVIGGIGGNITADNREGGASARMRSAAVKTGVGLGATAGALIFSSRKAKRVINDTFNILGEIIEYNYKQQKLREEQLVVGFPQGLKPYLRLNRQIEALSKYAYGRQGQLTLGKAAIIIERMISKHEVITDILEHQEARYDILLWYRESTSAINEITALIEDASGFDVDE